MARGAVVVILSDGWDRGDPDVLAEQMAAAAPGRPPGGVGEPAEGVARATRRWPGAWPRRCRTSTSSSRATRSASLEELAEVIARVTATERPMKEVLDDIERWRAGGPAGRGGPGGRRRGLGPARPGRGDGRQRRRRGRGSVSGGCVEGAVVDRGARRCSPASGDRGVVTLRLHRRRGVRGRAHLRRHDPPLRRAARLVTRRRRDLRRAARRARAPSEPVALATRRSTGPNVGRQAARRARRPSRSARSATPTSTGSSPATRWASSRPGSTVDPPLRRARRGPRGRPCRCSSSRSRRRRG